MLSTSSAKSFLFTYDLSLIFFEQVRGAPGSRAHVFRFFALVILTEVEEVISHARFPGRSPAPSRRATPHGQRRERSIQRGEGCGAARPASRLHASAPSRPAHAQPPPPGVCPGPTSTAAHALSALPSGPISAFGFFRRSDAYSGDCDRLFRPNVTGDSAGSAL